MEWLLWDRHSARHFIYIISIKPSVDIFQMGKVEHEEIKPLTQGHITWKCQNPNVFYCKESDVFPNENF